MLTPPVAAADFAGGLRGELLAARAGSLLLVRAFTFGLPPNRRQMRYANRAFDGPENWREPPFTLKELRDAVPAHCFQRSAVKSFSYLGRDLLLIASLAYAVTVTDNHLLKSGLGGYGLFLSRAALWACYWWFQGLAMTGVWVLAHECGHQAFSTSSTVNHGLGLVLHSALLVPYHSWRITHAKHHKANAHMEKDQVYVPNTRSEVRHLLDAHGSAWKASPLHDFFLIVRMLTIGWWGYLLTNVSGQRYPGKWVNHFDTKSPLFEHHQERLVLISNVGLLAALTILTGASIYWGLTCMIAYYFIPYTIVNAWLVTITYLQHTDERVPHFREGKFSFLLGALSTVDRDFGRFLNSMLHGIAHTHVCHHLFSAMPHYHAEEATRAIRPILGDYYHCTSDSIPQTLWRSWTKCRFVEDEGDLLWFKNGKH